MTAAVSLTDLQNAYTDLQTLKDFANAPGPTITTRLGATIYTLQGFLASVGYLPPVAYTTGLVVNTVLYTVTSGGLTYGPLPSLVPFTTSGAFNPAQWYLLQVNPSAYIKTLLDDIDAPTARTTLGAAASGANTDITSLLLANAGLLVKDVGGSFALEVKPGSTLTANRILTVTTGDNARTLDLTAASIAPSAFVATLLDDTSAANFMTTLGISAFIQTLLDDANAATARATIGANKYIREIDLGDETTTITTGTNKFKYRMPTLPGTATLTKVSASLSTASSSGIPTIDIKKNTTTVLSTKLTIDATEVTSITAAAAPVISVSSVAADDEYEIDITIAGTGAKGLKIQMEFTY